VATADRMLSIFGLFSTERAQWTVEAAAAELGLSVSTTYRYFRSLADAGLIAPYTTGRYVLGPAIVQYDRLTRHFDPLISTARPAMMRLVASCGCSAVSLLCRMFHDQVMCVHQEVGGQPAFALSFERGQLQPPFRGAVSTAILANLPPRTVRQYFRRLQPQAGEEVWTAMRARLRGLRGRVCVTRGEIDAGLIGIAAPIFGAPGEVPGEVVGSLGIVISSAEAPAALDGLAAAVGAAAAESSVEFARRRAADSGAAEAVTAALTSGAAATESGGNSQIMGNPVENPARRRRAGGSRTR
jgi:DNA-binding IclR family transcriptional regulator